MRRRPSTSRVSFVKACSVVWERLLAASDAQLVRVHGIRRVEDREIDVRVRVVDLERRQRHEPPHLDRVPQRGRARGTRIDIARPTTRAATAQLAASRFTSHSHGAGRVSSKSLTSKVRRRSGVAYAPKFRRCASPHACTLMPVCGRPREIPRHHHRRAPEEREVGLEHPRVAHGHEIGEAPAVRLLEQVDRIRPVGRQIELGVTRSRHAPAQLATRVDQFGARHAAEVADRRDRFRARGTGLGHRHGAEPYLPPDARLDRTTANRGDCSRAMEIEPDEVLAGGVANAGRRRARRVTRCTGPRTCTRRRSTVSCRRSPPPASTARRSPWASKPAASDSCSSRATCRCLRIRSGPSSDTALASIARLLRRFHTASRGFDPSGIDVEHGDAGSGWRERRPAP